MSAVSDAIANFQTALTNKLTDLKANEYFSPDPLDPSGTIKTTKNVKVIGRIDSRGDIEGNQDIT